jgi:hypothetical protein
MINFNPLNSADDLISCGINNGHVVPGAVRLNDPNGAGYKWQGNYDSGKDSETHRQNSAPERHAESTCNRHWSQPPAAASRARTHTQFVLA